MGGDGGCHPNGRKFMRGTMEKTKEEKERVAKPDRREQVLIRTRTCALSNAMFEEGTPIVADELGSLFSKEAVLRGILERTLPPEFQHIRSLKKDLIELRFFSNSEKRARKGAVEEVKITDNDSRSLYVCPITQLELNGRNPFVVIRGTQAPVNVISHKALRELGVDGLQQEYGPFDEQDVIRLIPTEEERAELIKRMAARREAERVRKERKKDKKRKLGGAAEEEVKAPKPERPRPAVKKAHISDSIASKYLGSVLSETAKSINETKEANANFAKLFKGTGSQKPADANHQFIVQSGNRYLLN